MNEELLRISEGIVKRASIEGFNESAALSINTRRTMLKIANSEPSITQHWSSLNVVVYLAKDRRIIIMEFHPRDESEIYKSMADLLKVAAKVMESPLYAPLPEPVEVRPLEGLVDREIVERLEEPSTLAEAAIEAAHREKIDSIAGTIDLWYREKALSTSSGVSLYEDSTGFQAYLRAFAEPSGSGQWSTCSTRFNLRSIEGTALTAAKYAVESRYREKVEVGKYDVIMSPMVFGNLLELTMRMASAFNVLMGLSMFMGKKPGDKIASDKLRVFDEPRNTELPRATSFDDEGVPTYNKAVIDGGVLKTLLHNSKTASKMGAVTTGNAGWISPAPWNITVGLGDYSLDEMISEVRRGILITNNWYTRLQNYVEGVFSTVSRDAVFLIEDGKVVKSIEKIRIADRLPSILNNIEALGKDLYNIMWWEVTIPSKLPYVLIKDVNVTKPTI